MANTIVMQYQFEKNKNIKASAATAVVCGCIFLLFFFVRWSNPTLVQPIITEGIEVNIGNSDIGSGTEQPMEPGDLGNATNTDDASATTPTNTSTANNTPTDSDPDGAAITTPSKKITPTLTTNTATAKKIATTSAVTTPKPKMVMSKYNGGNSTGGNNADSYRKSLGEGNDAEGNGDKGKSFGTFTGKAYDGAGGISIRNGLIGRKPTKLPSFEDDFNENAKVAIDITINKNGKVIGAIVNPKGTSTANPTTRKIAIKRALEIQFSAGAEDQTGTIVLDMRIRG